MNYKKIIIGLIIVCLYLGFFNQNSFAQNTNPLCSISLRGTTPSHKPQDLYKPDPFKVAYMIATKSIVSSGVLDQASINGNIARHNNFSNCNQDNPTNTEKSLRESRRKDYKDLPSVKVSIVNNNVSLSDATKMQKFINASCSLTLVEDGRIGIKTLNAISYCRPPAGGKLSRNDFVSLTNAGALFSDDKGNDLIYDSGKKTFSSNFNVQNIYVDISNPTAKTKGITDQASADAKGLKIVDKTGLSNNACFKKLGISYFVASGDVNSIGDNCCYNKDTESQGWKISDDIATYSTIPVFGSSSFDISIPICKSSCRFASPEKGSDNEKIYLEALNNSGFVKGSCDTGCPPNHVEVMKGGSMLCEKCDMKKCNCGIKLNTNIPFIGRCIMNKQTNNVGQSGDVMTVNSLNAFPILMGALIKLLMSIIMIVCFASLIVGGFMMTVPDQYDTGKGIIKKVVWTIVALGSLGTILYLINPNFFA